MAEVRCDLGGGKPSQDIASSTLAIVEKKEK
jgi:hypothetical protein